MLRLGMFAVVAFALSFGFSSSGTARAGGQPTPAGHPGASPPSPAATHGAPAGKQGASPTATPGQGQADPLVLVRLDAVELRAHGELSITTATTIIQFPGEVRVTNESAVRGVVQAGSASDMLFLQAAPGAALGDTATVELSVNGFTPAAIAVRVERAGIDTGGLWEMMPVSQLQRAREAREAEIQDRVDEALRTQAVAHEEELANKDAERERAVRDARRRALLEEVHSNAYAVVRLDGQECVGEALALCPDVYSRSSKNGVLKLWIHNRTSQELATESIHARLIDQVSRVDHAFDQLVTDAKDRSVSVIAPGERAKISVLLDDPDKIGFNLRVVLLGAASILPADRYLRIPNTWEWAENERRKERIEREAKRVSLHLTGSYGAILFPSGVSGIDGTEAASLKGLAVRLTKGLWPMLALEAELGGATSGVATFDDVTVDDTMGDLTRSAKLARTSVGGVLRFGDKVVPHVRLGVGLQLVDEVTTLQTGGGSMEMAGSGLAFGGSVYGGASVNVKLGSNLIAGLGFSYTRSDKDHSILDFGLNLAYRWDPPKNTGGDF